MKNRIKQERERKRKKGMKDGRKRREGGRKGEREKGRRKSSQLLRFGDNLAHLLPGLPSSCINISLGHMHPELTQLGE